MDASIEQARALASIANSLSRIADALSVVNSQEFAALLLSALEESKR